MAIQERAPDENGSCEGPDAFLTNAGRPNGWRCVSPPWIPMAGVPAQSDRGYQGRSEEGREEMVTPLHTAHSQVNGLTKENDRLVRKIWIGAAMIVTTS